MHKLCMRACFTCISIPEDVDDGHPGAGRRHERAAARRAVDQHVHRCHAGQTVGGRRAYPTAHDSVIFCCTSPSTL